jgi:hypothetical protein
MYAIAIQFIMNIHEAKQILQAVILHCFYSSGKTQANKILMNGDETI